MTTVTATKPRPAPAPLPPRPTVPRWEACDICEGTGVLPAGATCRGCDGGGEVLS